ncbi:MULTISPECIES: BREX system ATP-binding domain-containing protein [unclassified Nocardioides]|uniref:BREX system ATP-binding domain-containing protein n=1 Tax=unclassified Nocardioides TaxID=2615069 RepID=UPI00070270EE|nr:MULTISPECIES: BREX system ATP-binding domain-containing protein [unclassified Nocardioides]KRC57008.1 hypothetical protein ASE19_04195 [Nocardioides sp. Root79]KRC77217.1 hypothetical protein ASE20_03060 [Nocardioides sp. Root240]
MTTTAVHVGVLGPTTIKVAGQEVDLGSLKQRALLAVLALGEGHPVSTDRIIHALWHDSPPSGVTTTLHGYIASVRRLLEPSRAPRTAPSILVTAPGGYALRLGRAGTDVAVLATAVERATTALRVIPETQRPVAAPQHHESLRACHDDLAQAVALWRGSPYADLGDTELVEAERQRLRELLLTARTQQCVIELAVGDHAAAAPTLQRLTTEHPLREQLWILHAVALTRAGRQADALAALQQLRDVLVDELGIDPSPQVQALQRDILRQDASLVERAPSAVVSAASVPPRSIPSFPWPLVGRRAEIRSLEAALDRAAGARQQLAHIVGEPGIGKSRLTRELATLAAHRGFVHVEGRCSPDDGAPPLWAWQQVLRAVAEVCQVEVPDLAATVQDSTAEQAAIQFLMNEAIAEALRQAAAVAPLMIAIEDVHWADASTLRVLRHLAEHGGRERILLCVTQRPDDGSGATLELGYAFARADATRLDLVGLDATESAMLVTHVAGARAEGVDGRRLQERTGGNPFFLSEVARSRDPLGGAATAPLSELVAQRVRTLAAPTRELLEAAAVVDRVVNASLVAAAAHVEDASLIDRLAPAQAAGLLVTEPDGRLAFAHAIVREAVLGAMRPVVVEQWHARVARALESRQLRGASERSALAYHWREAGYAHAGRAWRAAVSAAEAAREVHATEEAAVLLAQALESQRLDATSADIQRYELLMQLASARRVAADWAGAAAAVTQAIATAERMGEPELAARASVGSVEGAVWHARTYGTVQDDLVAALRRALNNLPAGDSELRCRAMLCLAVEAYYLAPPAETDALVEEALAIAERIADPRLLVVALQLAFSARWRPATAEWRLSTIRRGHEIATALGDVHLEVTCRAFLAIVLVELGHVDEGRELIGPTIELASRHGILTAVTILEMLRAPMLLLSGEDEAAEVCIDHVIELAQRVTVPNMDHATAALKSVQVLWQGRFDELSAVLTQLIANQTVPVDTFVVAMLLRVGDVSKAREVFDATFVEPGDRDYMGVIQHCLAGEVALGLGESALAARTYRWLKPYAGRISSAGSTTIMGPVDAFLALAAAATGDLEAAAGHADDAMHLCDKWGFHRVSAWLEALRAQHRF